MYVRAFGSFSTHARFSSIRHLRRASPCHCSPPYLFPPCYAMFAHMHRYHVSFGPRRYLDALVEVLLTYLYLRIYIPITLLPVLRLSHPSNFVFRFALRGCTQPPPIISPDLTHVQSRTRLTSPFRDPHIHPPSDSPIIDVTAPAFPYVWNLAARAVPLVSFGLIRSGRRSSSPVRIKLNSSLPLGWIQDPKCLLFDLRQLLFVVPAISLQYHIRQLAARVYCNADG